MRLTSELIEQSLSYINTLKERELDLRGNKIPAIENLGAARDQDCIDFTDNSISTLANFPLSPRLTTLLLAHNRISTISPALHTSIPNLTTLVLTKNRIVELADLDPLAQFPNLTHLALLDNPVTRKPNYRYWVLWRCPSLRFLDFRKVKLSERLEAADLFGLDHDHMTDLAASIQLTKSAPSTAIHHLADSKSTPASHLSSTEKKRLEELIRNAKSLDEIARLELEMNQGTIRTLVSDHDSMHQ